MIIPEDTADSSHSSRQQSRRAHTSISAPTLSNTNSLYSPPAHSRSLDALTQPTYQPYPLSTYGPPLPARPSGSRNEASSHDLKRPSLNSEEGFSESSYTSEKDGLPGYSPKLDAEATFQDDGRLDISFGSRLSKKLPDNYAEPVHEVGIDETGFHNAPPMSINIMIVGSRGDVQPYLALGQRLQQYGHTVRLSTHETFRKLVKDAGLLFFNIGGDPHELMSYMVRNPGLIPGFESTRNGDIGKKQKMVAEILERCLLSCYEADEGSPGEPGFAADAIISNPPTFAHIHCAEALGIPLLLSFTMPWCPTASFPHPLVNIKQTGSSEPTIVNYYSYGLVDLMTWQGLGHVINKFRMKRLGLEYLNTASAVGVIERCGIPWTYCLSPALVAKPQDWTNHIDVVGFYFLNLAKDYHPHADLVEFISSGEPPIYVGFGSIVLENPQEMTKAVLGGIALAGVRAIVSPGWGGLDEAMIKEAGPHVFALGNVPHDWLFEYVSAVCHHGGAGTTAIGLKCGKPTIILPFFGDQPWWAAQLQRRGAGPPALNPKSLTAEAFASAIRIALSPNTVQAARSVGDMIQTEDGTRNGVDSFHRHMPLLNMRCELDPNRVAVWYCPTHRLRLSAFAAQVLAEGGEIDINKLKLHRSREYDTHAEAVDPVTGVAAPALKIINDFGRGMAKLPKRPDKGLLKMTTASLVGLQGTLQGATEGLANVPKLYGGEVREHKKVKGFGSGVVEGTKGLAFGLYDGLSDFVKEPIKGYEKRGVLGAVGGAGIGSMNLMTKPISGMMQFFSMPMEGTAKDLRGLFRKEIGRERVVTRYAEGVLAVKRASQQDRDVVIKAFAEFKVRSWRERKGKEKAK